MIQKIKLNPSQILTKDNILNSLQKARSAFDYFQVNMKFNHYITVAFFRDGTFDVMTNIRGLELWNQIEVVRRSYGLTILTDYMFNWIRRYNS